MMNDEEHQKSVWLKFRYFLLVWHAPLGVRSAKRRHHYRE